MSLRNSCLAIATTSMCQVCREPVCSAQPILTVFPYASAGLASETRLSFPRIYKNGGRQSAPEADCQRSMIVLLMIRGTCAGFRAKNVQVSGHLPPLLAWRYRIMALVGEGGFGAVYK